MKRVQAKKIEICLSCCTPFVQGGKCKSCGSASHLFDSTSEMRRYVALKDKASCIKVQYPTPVFVSEYKTELEGLSNKLPDFVASGVIKQASTYKIDFYYYDPEHPQGLVLEEFKYSTKKRGKWEPYIDEGARIKLKLLSEQVAGIAVVQVSYPDKSVVGGYGVKVIKARVK